MHPALPSADDRPCSSRDVNMGKVSLTSRKKSRKKCGRMSNRDANSSNKLQTFQKKLVVLKYMGNFAPAEFTRKEDTILFRGLLPEISYEANEAEIRTAIMNVLHNNKSFQLQDFDMNDFEFMNAHGKKISVPTIGDGYEFNGKSIKQLAGIGAIYVRITKKIPSRFPIFISDDSDFEPEQKEVKQDGSDSSFELPELPNRSSLVSRPTVTHHSPITLPCSACPS